MGNKQTAVEWLEDSLRMNFNKIFVDTDFGLISHLIEQAKQMEKEQILDAFGEKRQFMGFGDNDEFWITDMTAEQFYNENYGK
jgi:c-di-AMP phosphodiesterase-like protein